MPTGRGEVEGCCQGDLHHGAVTRPAAQSDHSTTREAVAVVSGLEAHTDARMAYRREKERAAMLMGIVERLTASVDCRVELMPQ